MEFYDLCVHQGESLSQKLLFKDQSGDAMDLTGYTGYSQVRPDPDSDELTAEITVTIAAADGLVALELSDEETQQIPAGIYAYDFAMERPDGTVKYYIGGKFAVLPAVTEINHD